MQFQKLPLAGLVLIKPTPITDERGSFSRIFCEHKLAAAGLSRHFPQENRSICMKPGVIRGLHLQLSPNAEDKLVRCTQGEIFDVVVDCRKGSPTFLKTYSIQLSHQEGSILYVPKGFAHGYQSLTNAAEATYRASSAYSPESEKQLRFNDPKLKIRWPISDAVVSDKDSACELIHDDFKGWNF